MWRRQKMQKQKFCSNKLKLLIKAKAIAKTATIKCVTKNWLAALEKRRMSTRAFICFCFCFCFCYQRAKGKKQIQNNNKKHKATFNNNSIVLFLPTSCKMYACVCVFVQLLASQHSSPATGGFCVHFLCFFFNISPVTLACY